ncbi:hypothetical protein NTHI1209_00527 [Haemophilus influenzae]|uniref:Uncharacterized protein n=1 Tax=Haemophilus influenzae TaxID=727 RepID=A0A158SVN0_HAEIF|nr:hypothetical protein NTHI1209_00527 [Haemophilus influenzae]
MIFKELFYWLLKIIVRYEIKKGIDLYLISQLSNANYNFLFSAVSGSKSNFAINN